MKDLDRNTDFLLKISPVKMTVLAFLVWLFLFFTAPLVVKIPLATGAYILMGLSIGAFILACKIPTRTFKVYEISEDRLKSVFKVILVIAGIGLAFKLTDRFLIRGISFGIGNMLNRDLMSGASGNPVGIAASLLAPFSYIPLFIVWKYKLKLWFPVKILVYTVYFTQILDAIVLGSRSVIFVNFIILLMYLIFFKKLKLKLRTYFFIGALLFGIAVMMNFMFIQRTKEFFGDKVYDLVLNESNFNFTETGTEEFKNNFAKYGDLQKSVAFTYMVTTQYFTHGMLEFSYLYQEYKANHTGGRYTFDIYFRFLDKLLPTKLAVEDPEKIIPRTGVYTTLIGPLFIDFGWFVIVFMYIFGRLVKIVYATALKGADWAIILYFYFFIIIIFWPVFNFLSGAGGMFTITSLLVFAFISSRIYSRKIN